MITIRIREPLAEQLTRVAAQEQRSVEEVVASILENHRAEWDVTIENAPAGSAAAFIRAALAADIHTGERDVAARSREILDEEYGEYLKQ